MKIDFHIHTNKSDGIYSEKDIYDFVLKNDVKCFSITDHDNVDAVKTFLNFDLNNDIKFIPGVEFTVDFDRGEFHLLGYNIDVNNAKLNSIITELKESRLNRSKLIVEDFQKSGIDISYDELLQEFPETKSFGKPHIARILVKHGIVKDINRAFDKYFINGKVGDIPKKKISLDQAISIIKESGGFSIIAHPHSLNLSKSEFENHLNSWIDAGICGLEVYASFHKKPEIDYYRNICEKYNLLISGGSDFHGDRYEKIGYYGSKELEIEKFENFLKKAGF